MNVQSDSSVDNYDVNVFDLSNPSIWRSKSNKYEKPNGEIVISDEWSAAQR